MDAHGGDSVTGEWYLSTRGSRAEPQKRWQHWHLENGLTLEDLQNLAQWAHQGHHVKIEFIPDGMGLPDCDH